MLGRPAWLATAGRIEPHLYRSALVLSVCLANCRSKREIDLLVRHAMEQIAMLDGAFHGCRIGWKLIAHQLLSFGIAGCEREGGTGECCEGGRACAGLQRGQLSNTESRRPGHKTVERSR